MASGQRGLEAFYDPNLRLTRAYGLLGYNAGYAESADSGSFDRHQQDLVWRLLGDAHIDGHCTVVDIGCGIGGPSGWIYDRYRPGRLIGIDYCLPSVRVAEERWAGSGRRPFFLQSDAHRLPLPDASVDVIFNLESALHYADKRTFIAECRRILKPGGRLCLGDICTRHKRLFAALGLLNVVQTQFSTQSRLWHAVDYQEAFASAGLRLIRHEEVGRQASASLAGGLKEVAKKGWKAARGYRGRFFYLCLIEWFLRHGVMTYELFNVEKNESHASPEPASKLNRGPAVPES
jgi:SAM-dependent methyltransferase